MKVEASTAVPVGSATRSEIASARWAQPMRLSAPVREIPKVLTDPGPVDSGSNEPPDPTYRCDPSWDSASAPSVYRQGTALQPFDPPAFAHPLFPGSSLSPPVAGSLTSATTAPP